MVLFNASVTLTQMLALKDSSVIGVAGCTLPKIFLDRIGNKIAVSQPRVARKEEYEKKKSIHSEMIPVFRYFSMGILMITVENYMQDHNMTWGASSIIFVEQRKWE